MHQNPASKPLPFGLTVRIEGRITRLIALQTHKGIGEERYSVIAKNKILVFSTNKPIVERRGLKDFPWKWKMVSGQLQNQRAKELITEALEAHLRGKNYDQLRRW